MTATDHASYETATLGTSTLKTTELPIQGMTCAACVRRVERALTKVPGVQEAVVNLVTERATVRFDPETANPSVLADAIQAAGYKVRLAGAPSSPVGTVAGATAGGDGLSGEAEEERQLRRDLRTAVLLTVPLLVLAMSHGLIPGSDGELGRAVQLALGP